MASSNNRHAFVVGLFILAGIAIVIAGVFIVGSQEKFFTRKFTVRSRFDDVGGLQAGNNIWLSGVKVGTVKAIRFQGDAQVEITMHIDEAARSRIWKNSMTRISTDGFIGNKIVIIYGGASSSGIVADNDLLKSSKGVSTDQVMSVLETSNNNLLQITENLKRITSQISSGKGALGALIYEQDIQNDLHATLRNFKKASVSGDELMNGLVEFSSKLNNGKGMIHELITDTTIFNGLHTSVQHLNETIDKASAFADKLNAEAGSLSEKDKPAGMLLHNEKVAEDLKDLINNLKVSSENLNEDLKALQHNFLFRGYFKKKAKGKLN